MVSKERLASVKADIDIIYELTKNGYDGSFTSLKSAKLCKVATYVLNSGAMTKTRVGKKGKKGLSCHYQWVANSAPTERFYLNIAGKMSQHEKKVRADWLKKGDLETKVSEAISEAVPETPAIAPKVLADYSLDELWGEMQSRGVVIENNHLVIVERRVIA